MAVGFETSASLLNRGEATAGGGLRLPRIWALVTRGRREVYANRIMLGPRSKQVSDGCHL